MKLLRHFFAIALIAIAVLVIYPKFKAMAGDIPALLKEAKRPLLIFLCGFQVAAYFGNGWLSKILLEMAGFKVRLKDTIRIAILGVFGSQFSPIGGVAAVTYYFYRKLNLPTKVIFFLIAGWMVFAGSIYFCFFLLALLVLPGSCFCLLPLRVVLAALVSLLFLIPLSYLLFKNRGKNFLLLLTFLSRLVNRLGKYFNHKSIINHNGPEILVSDFYNAFAILVNNKRQIPKAVLASLLFYSGNLATLYFSFLVFGFRPALALVIFGSTASSILTIFSLMPDTPGIMESSLVATFIWLGFPAHITVFSALLFRLFSYWLPMPLGVFSYLRFKKEIGWPKS